MFHLKKLIFEVRSQKLLYSCRLKYVAGHYTRSSYYSGKDAETQSAVVVLPKC